MTKVIKYYIPMLDNKKHSDQLCQNLKQIKGVLSIDTDLEQKKCSITVNRSVEIVDILSAIEQLDLEYYFLNREMV